MAHNKVFIVKLTEFGLPDPGIKKNPWDNQTQKETRLMKYEKYFQNGRKRI